MDEQIRRELRMLKGYAIVLTALFGTLALAAFKAPAHKEKFTEIDVERINIVEPDGKMRMVISNRPRSIGPIYKGKPFGYEGGGRPGIIFFNDEGTENGGLTFTGKKEADGTYTANTGLSFDQFNQDQILYFQYSDRNGQRRADFTIADRAPVDIYDMIAERDSLRKIADTTARRIALEKWAEPRNGQALFAPRVYIGRDRARSAVINLSDPSGKTRMRMMVDSLGAASLQFLDAAGKVTATFPDKK